MKSFLKCFKGAFLFSIGMLLVCGLLYPAALTAVSQVIFHEEANGSLIRVDGEAIGSKLVGQNFEDARLFKCRPSSLNYNTYTAQDKEKGTYTGVSSGSNNYAPTNPALKERVEADIKTFLKENPDVERNNLPTDLLTASGSGLDPHISVPSAQIQIPAIAKASGLSEATLSKIVKNNTQGKALGIFGEEHVNVLKCNLEIAKLIGMI